MKRPRLSYGRRQLLKASAELREMFPPTPEQKLLIDAAINLRAAKGVFKDAYTPDELDMLAQARRTALETGQTKVLRFVTPQTRRPIPNLIEIPPEKGVHACPQCGEFHRDSGVRTAGRLAIKQEEQLFLHLRRWFSSAKFRHDGLLRVRKCRRLKRKKAREQT